MEGSYVDDLELLEQYDLQHEDESDDSRSDGQWEADGVVNSDDESQSPDDFAAVFEELRATTVEILSALGGIEESLGEDRGGDEEAALELYYVVGDDCLRCLRDLRKLWREGAEDPDRTIARVFAEVGVLQNLIPLLLKTAGGDERFQKISLACTDLLTSITWPVDANAEVREALTRGEGTEDLSHLFALEREMVKYKAAILRQRSGESVDRTGSREIVNCIMRFVLLPALSKPRHHRNERDVGTISMSLHFFRNLLAIQDPVATTLSSAEQISNSTLQSELICTMARSHVLETLLMLANSAESRDYGQWNAITLECVYAIFGGEEVTIIASGANGLEEVPTEVNTPSFTLSTPPSTVARPIAAKAAALASSLNSEAHQRRVALVANGSSRHSRFGTSINFFTSDGDVRVARDVASLRKTVHELRQNNELRAKRTFRRRKRAREEGAPRVKAAWTPPAREALKNWSDRFLLSSGFEILTRSCLNDIRSEREKVGDLDQARIRVMLVGVFFLDYFLLRQTEEFKREAVAKSKFKEPINNQPLRAIQVQPSAAQGDERDATTEPTPFSNGTDSPAIVNVGEAQKADDSGSPTLQQEPAVPTGPQWSFSLLSDWFKPWAFKMVLVRTDSALDSKGWLEMTASLQLWMSLLRLIDALSQSAEEEDRDLAEHLQANHFYHSETLDLCVKISRCFTTQSFEFLRCVIAFANVMPRMLERYSLNKEHIFVRAKRHARKAKEKKLGVDADQQEEDEEGGQDPEAKAQVTYTERRFSFDRFQNKLCTRPLVEACVSYLGRWRDYHRPADELANVVAVMHRIAIKANDARNFFPAHIRVAFQAILKGPLVPALRPRAPRAVTDTKRLIDFVLKKYDKLSPEEKRLWTFGKPPPRLAKAVKLLREIEVKPGLNRDDQVGIAVGLLAEKGMIGRAIWIKSALELASAERTGLVLSIDGKRMWEANKRVEGVSIDDSAEPNDEEREGIIHALSGGIPSDEAVANFEPYELRYDGDVELQRDASTCPPLKLLARLMSLESDESDPEHWRWRVPDHILPTHLDADIKLIEERLQTPLEINGTSYEEYVQFARKKRTFKAKALAPADLGVGDSSESDSSSGSDSGSLSSPSDTARRKRKTTRRRRDLKGGKTTQKMNRTFKRRKIETGPLFLQDDVIDSDEDEQVEALWRARNGQAPTETRSRSSSPSSRPKAKARSVRPRQVESEDEMSSSEDHQDSPLARSSVARRIISARRGSSSELSDTPPTSPPLNDRSKQTQTKSKHGRSSNVSQSRTNRSQALFLATTDEEESEEEDVNGAKVLRTQPVTSSAQSHGQEKIQSSSFRRPNRPSAFAFSDSDDEESNAPDEQADLLKRIRDGDSNDQGTLDLEK